MFRDFQSRNIMLVNGDLYFIDYQGGRRGALQYDVASFLFEARVDLSPSLRQDLLEHYLETLGRFTDISPGEFRDHYYGFVLVRILQAMGAYGIRGIVERKPLFLESIPFALRNIRWLRDNNLIPDGIPELSRCLDRICDMEDPESTDEPDDLTVIVYSFSYKKGLPVDVSGHGGGFVFDCRALPNPGREERFRDFTGLDREVVEFLEEKEEVSDFLEKTFSLVGQSVRDYSERRFNYLMVSYGCTGGQHRSVYCAERLGEFLTEKTDVNTRVIHRELTK
jgi:hypothetical protein